MRLVTFNKEISLQVRGKKDKLVLSPATPYIMPDGMIKELAQVYGIKIVEKNVDFNLVYKEYHGEPLDDKTLFCFRAGGIGDLMFMTIGIDALKRKYPTCKVIAGSAPGNIHVFYKNRNIEEIVEMPYPYYIAEKADYQLYFEGIIEENPNAHNINAYDLFLEAFYIDHEKVSMEHKAPHLSIMEDSMKKIGGFFNSFKNNKRITIGYQLKTSSIIRDYPQNSARKLIKLLLEKYRVMLLGAPHHGLLVRELEIDDENVVDCTQLSTNLHDFFAIVKHCDAIIGGDSSGLHIAAAFEKPILGLFGAFDSRLRLCYYKNAIAIQGTPICAPCFLHGDVPCRNKIDDGYTACMALIEPEKIVEVFEENIVPLVRRT